MTDPKHRITAMTNGPHGPVGRYRECGCRGIVVVVSAELPPRKPAKREVE